MQANGKPAQLLLVEDSPADVELTRQGLKRGRLQNTLHVVMDGEAALDFLYRRGEHAEAVRPDLILLDLNLPGMDGRTVLKKIKSDPNLCDIPVLVLTTSDAEADVLGAYRDHANSYLRKPVDFGSFVEAINGLSEYWFSLVRLPPK